MNRNIQIILDMSMSMKDTISMVYIFLYEFFSYLQKIRRRSNKDVNLTYQITWVSGTEHHMVEFENGVNYTDSYEILLENMKRLHLKRGKSSDKEIIEAFITSSKNAHGKGGEQVILYFSDYYISENQVNLELLEGINRVLLFVPRSVGRKYRFRLVGTNNVLKKDIPVLMWNLEHLNEVFSEDDMNNIKNMMGLFSL